MNKSQDVRPTRPPLHLAILGALCFALFASYTQAATLVTQTITIPVDLASLANGNVCPVAYTVGYKFKMISATFAVVKPATTGSKASTLTMKIGSTAITGFSIALTSANCTPVGALVASSAITALNVGAATDTITLVAGSTTTFVEGSGVLILQVQARE